MGCRLRPRHAEKVQKGERMVKRKPIKLMTPDERRAYNRDTQRRRRARISSDPQEAKEQAAKNAEYTARWLAGVKADATRSAAYEERQRVRNREKYLRNKNSPQVENSGLQRPKNQP
jgi:hypothetical protein